MNKSDFQNMLAQAIGKLKFVDQDYTPGLYRLDVVVKLTDDGVLRVKSSYLGKGEYRMDGRE